MNNNIRTDLVIDMISNIKDKNLKIRKRYINDDIKILNINVLNKKNKLKKKVGKYITISFSNYDKNIMKEIEEVTIKELKKLFKYLKITLKKKCLVIGLGNRYITPDSLGSKTIDNILVTKYLFDMRGLKINKRYRNVSAFTPSVKGNTGIESKDIILGIIDKTKPDFLIIIDALASSSIDRINKTIQMTTAGINPGSGAYNNRGELSYETLGIPVISIGIPTVIEAVTLVNDTLKYMDINNIKKELIYDTLNNLNYNMIVTPKEIDLLIEKESILLANVINKSLHQNFDI